MTIKENYLTKRERDCMVSIREKGMEDFPLRLNELAGILKISSPTALNILRNSLSSYIACRVLYDRDLRHLQMPL